MEKIKEWWKSQTKEAKLWIIGIIVIIATVITTTVLISCMSVSAEHIGLNTDKFEFNAENVNIKGTEKKSNPLEIVKKIETETCFMNYNEKMDYLEKIGFTASSYEQYLNVNHIMVLHNTDGTLKEVKYNNEVK